MLLIFSLLLVSAAVADDQEDQKFSKSTAGIVKSLREKIVVEIKEIGEGDWAGVYYEGDGLGENVSIAIAPKSGYVFEWRGCLGLYDRNYGQVESKDGQIHLSFTFENQQKGFQGISPKLVPVVWGSRRYLIPADDLVGFCNNINAGSEPRMQDHGSYLLRRGDESKKVTGFPQVPDEYLQYLLEKPIEAKIIAVGAPSTRPSVADWKFKDTPVTIDAGRKHGLRVGMELIVTKPGDAFGSFKITKVAEVSSEAIMTQMGEEGLGPQVRWRLSTQSPWRVERKK